MRNQGQGHIRQRGKNGRRRGTIQARSGAFQVRYSLGRDPVSGKRRRATATVKGSRKDAERELTRLLRTVDTGEHPEPRRMSVADWLNLWLASTKIEVSPKTHERYAEIVRCYLVPGIGGLALQRLAPSDIQRAYNSFTRKPSPRTRRHIHRIALPCPLSPSQSYASISRRRQRRCWPLALGKVATRWSAVALMASPNSLLASPMSLLI
jgi:hypothetical protein